MTTYVSLLRAVNVGGRTIPMKALREVYEGQGFDDVRSYIQSGNLVFRSTLRSDSAVTKSIEGAIKKAFGMEVHVLVRTQAEMTKIARAHPFSKLVDGRGNALYVTFLAAKPSAAKVKTIDAEKFAPDVFKVVGREIFACYPKGYGNSKLSLPLFERALGIEGTARNWNTVTKLAAMAAE
jgi:uncharacterized protein (DUF1697 family)